MKQEDKDLLLTDLCARLPYKVRCKVDKIKFEGELREIELSYNMARLYNVENDESENVYVYDCKPYLFPLSSMTEEQKKEYNRLKHEIPVCHYEYGDVVEEIELYDSPESFDYLIENHFDYYGLIPMGLANDATNLNIY